MFLPHERAILARSRSHRENVDREIPKRDLKFPRNRSPAATLAQLPQLKRALCKVENSARVTSSDEIGIRGRWSANGNGFKEIFESNEIEQTRAIGSAWKKQERK